jgi:hypothetical protein
MSSFWKLFIGVVAGAVGAGYFVWGKKRERVSFIIAGVGLCLFPYTTDSLVLLILFGAGLAAYPFIVEYYM